MDAVRRGVPDDEADLDSRGRDPTQGDPRSGEVGEVGHDHPVIALPAGTLFTKLRKPPVHRLELARERREQLRAQLLLGRLCVVTHVLRARPHEPLPHDRMKVTPLAHLAEERHLEAGRIGVVEVVRVGRRGHDEPDGLVLELVEPACVGVENRRTAPDVVPRLPLPHVANHLADLQPEGIERLRHTSLSAVRENVLPIRRADG